MLDKQSYIRQVEGQLANWHHDVYKFKIIAEYEEEEPDRQITEYQIIEDIVDKEKEVINMLDELKETEGNNWLSIKEEIDHLSKHVTDAIAAARYEVN